MDNQISESAKKLNGKELRNALPPAMPRKLPFLVAHLINNVPDGYRIIDRLFITLQ